MGGDRSVARGRQARDRVAGRECDEAPRGRLLRPKIAAVSTGSLRLKPTFLDGSPAHGGQIGLIRAIARDPGRAPPLPMWSWIVETGTERT